MLGTSPREAPDSPAPAADAARLPHLPGLDGLRALAVIAVIIYHGDVGLLPGGFLGVDLFFVLSGFLITSLLLAEHRSSGRIDLREFWGRRFRRLLPALLLFLAAVTAWAVLFADRSSLEGIRNDTLAGLGYVANWWFVVSGASYTGAFSAPSPLQHLWSLAVEEQYYLLWPFVALVCLGTALGARRGRRRLLVVSTVGFVASAGWMAWLAWNGADKDRMYFGTDTRAATILAGVLVALWMEPVLAARAAGEATPAAWASPGRRRAVTVLAVLGAVGLATAMAVADQRALWLYRGGFPLIALAAGAVVVGVVVLPVADRALGGPGLRWAGTRSYGLYLWHWLVLVALVTAWPRFTGWARLVVMCLAAGLLAEASYRLVERPIRTRRLRIPRPRVTVPAAFAVVALLAVGLGLRAEAPPSYLQTRSPDDVAMQPAEPAPTTTTTVAPAAPPPAPEPTVAGATTVPAPPPTQPPAPFKPPTRVLLVGDSVAASIADQMGSVLRSGGVAFADSAFPGCGIVEGDPAEPDGTVLALTAACGPNIAPNQRDVIGRTRPDLVVALSTWEASDRLWNGVFLPYGTPTSDDALLALYRRTVDRLTARGARVAFLTVPDPVDSLKGPADPVRRDRLRHLNGLLQRLAAEDPVRVSLVRLDDIVCPTDPCPTVVDGIALRGRDGTHYAEPETARYVAERLAPRIMQVPRGGVR